MNHYHAVEYQPTPISDDISEPQTSKRPIMLAVGAAILTAGSILVISSKANMNGGFGAETMNLKKTVKKTEEDLSGEPSNLTGMTWLTNDLRANTEPKASNLDPMTWSDDAQTAATTWAAECQYSHGGPGFGTLYGQNIYAYASASNIVPTATNAYNSWSSEKAYYSHTTNTCAVGKVCDHYTQLVWADSTTLGCALQKCTTGSPWPDRPTWYLTVCNYGPPGNLAGELPYQAATSEEESNDKVDYTSDEFGGEPVNLIGITYLHNDMRGATYPKAANMQNMAWNDVTYAAALSWVSYCKYSHGGPGFGTLYGQNLFAFASGITTLVPTSGTAFRYWSEQMAYYTYETNTCAAGKVCSAYTQIVWTESTTIGCAYKKCIINSPWVLKPVWHLIVCNYGPPGNWNGEWPYQELIPTDDYYQNKEDIETMQSSASFMKTESSTTPSS